jgi:hypothetical protein
MDEFENMSLEDLELERSQIENLLRPPKRGGAAKRKTQDVVDKSDLQKKLEKINELISKIGFKKANEIVSDYFDDDKIEDDDEVYQKIPIEELNKIVTYNRKQYTILSILFIAAYYGQISVKMVETIMMTCKFILDKLNPVNAILSEDETDGTFLSNFGDLVRLYIKNGGNVDMKYILDLKSKKKISENKVRIIQTILETKIPEIFIPSLPKACGLNKQWMKGEPVEISQNPKISSSYFPCGHYFFDGEYMVVKFPKGMTIYHGSALLANAVVMYPAGIKFYNPVPLGTTEGQVNLAAAKDRPYEIEQLLTEYIQVDAGWFTEPEWAKFYTKQNKNFPGCGDICLFSYELKEDSVFLLLDNDFNLNKILNDPLTPDEIKEDIYHMFSLDKAQTKVKHGTSSSIFNGIEIFSKKNRKLRLSHYDEDRRFALWACKFLTPRRYAGYCAPEQYNIEKDEHQLHLEFIFCNPFNFLKRNLNDKGDVHFFDRNILPKQVNLLFEQMDKYQTTNTNFHSGDLLQHSIWSLLFSEFIIGQMKTANIIFKDERFMKLIGITALVHDIGKMIPTDDEHTVKNISTKKILYFDIPNHSQIGAEYIKNGKIPKLDDNLNIIGEFDIHKVLLELLPDMTADEKEMIEIATQKQLHFSKDLLQKFVDNKNLQKYELKEFMDHFPKNENGVKTFFLFFIISLADILALQPYSQNQLANLDSDEIRFLLRSKLFPFISTVPKKYRGTSYAKDINALENGIKILNLFISTLKLPIP